MIQQQQPQAATIAPGNPIGYAPIYGPPPLATDAATPPTTQGNATEKRWIDGFLIGGLLGATLFALTTWGVLDNLYSGADIRGLKRQVEAANATAQAVEQRAANAEANAQQWQAHAGQQQQTLDGIRELICK